MRVEAIAGDHDEASVAGDSLASWQDVWIVIPAYNEARTIRSLAAGALAHCKRVIVVDDGSSDGTAEQLKALPVTMLTHDANRGKAASLRTAFAHALERDAACVITMDGDGQHDPADAATLLSIWVRNPRAIIIGSRLHDRVNFPRARWRANRLARFWISWAAGHPIADSQSGFRAYPVEAMRIAMSPRVRSGRFTFESELLIEAARNGCRTVAVAIPGCYPVHARPSHFRPVVDIAKIILMVAGRLLSQGMTPLGLLRSLRHAPVLPGRVPGALADSCAGRLACRSSDHTVELVADD